MTKHPKSEIRIPKETRNPNSETERPLFELCHSDFFLTSSLDLDSALEYKLRRAGQTNVQKAAIVFLETNFQLITTLNMDFDWRTEFVDAGSHERRGGDSGATCQGFAFDTALKCADANFARAEYLDEINIGAFRAEVRMTSNLRS